MTIDLKTIKHISKLSRISVDEQKAEKLAKKMNKYLADSLAGLNLVIAILVILSCAFVGMGNSSFIGFVVGGAVGFLLASMICGTYALLIDIRNEVVRLNESFDETTSIPFIANVT